jgi:hypothetical protein
MGVFFCFMGNGWDGKARGLEDAYSNLVIFFLVHQARRSQGVEGPE